MTIKFIGKTMPCYQGADGFGGSVNLQPGETASVSDATAAKLMRAYSKDFTMVAEAPAEPEEKADKAEEEPDHKPVTDKFFRKSNKVKTK